MSSADMKIGVVGAGAMGQGIVQVAMTGGLDVVVHDAVEGAAARGADAVKGRIDRMVEKGRLAREDADVALSRVTVAGSLDDLAGCEIVIEAVYEDLDLKREVFRELEARVGRDTVLASNTSSLLIASIARDCEHRDRIAGMHFFNPVPLMKLVEVVRGPETGDAAIEALSDIGRRMGREPVTVKDAPGFLVNLGGRAYTTEAMRLLHDRVATAAQIDAVMRECCGFRMGPLELADLTGVDVNYPVSLFIHEGYSFDPRLKTSFPHKSLFEAGRFGRKTGQGSYAYDGDGAQHSPSSPDHESDAEPARTVCVPGDDGAARDFAAELGAETVSGDDGASPILAALLGEDCSAFATRTGADYRRLVAVDLKCDWSRRVTIMTAPGADLAARDGVAALITASGRSVTAIKDSPGFISQRMRAMVANLGCEMAQIGIAEPESIDFAMRLGLNYSLGPLEMAEDLGLADTSTILSRLQDLTGEDRYRPSAWLRRRADLGLPVHTPD